MAARRGLSRAVVLEGAAKIVDAHGWERLSIAELAACLRVRPPSLYNHVKSLEDVKRELGTVALRELAASLGNAAIGKSRDDAVRSIADAYRAFVKKHPGLYQATLRAPDASDAERKRAGDETINICLAVVLGYGLDRRTALHALRGLRSAIHGFATLENAGGFGIPLSIDESFQWLIGCFIKGLAARNSRARSGPRRHS